jgi:hypothetical protein
MTVLAMAGRADGRLGSAGFGIAVGEDCGLGQNREERGDNDDPN